MCIYPMPSPKYTKYWVFLYQIKIQKYYNKNNNLLYSPVLLHILLLFVRTIPLSLHVYLYMLQVLVYVTSWGLTHWSNFVSIIKWEYIYISIAKALSKITGCSVAVSQSYRYHCEYIKNTMAYYKPQKNVKAPLAGSIGLFFCNVIYLHPSSNATVSFTCLDGTQGHFMRAGVLCSFAGASGESQKILLDLACLFFVHKPAKLVKSLISDLAKFVKLR